MDVDGGLRRGPGGRLRVSSAMGAGRSLLFVDGEVDFTTSPRLADALDEAVTSAAGRAELDLDGVSFCDFSCWDVLLAARERAREVGVEFTCVALSPVAERVLELTQVAPVLRAA